MLTHTVCGAHITWHTIFIIPPMSDVRCPMSFSQADDRGLACTVLDTLHDAIWIKKKEPRQQGIFLIPK